MLVIKGVKNRNICNFKRITISISFLQLIKKKLIKNKDNRKYNNICFFHQLQINKS